jgi:hypothetical protein
MTLHTHTKLHSPLNNKKKMIGAEAAAIVIDICWRTISATCSRTLDLTVTFLNDNHPSFTDFNSALTKSDLQARIRKFSEVVEAFKPVSETLAPSVKLAITDLESAIGQVEAILRKVQSQKAEHDQLWFSTWRRADCTPEIASLEQQSVIINQRFNDLATIYTLMHHLHLDSVLKTPPPRAMMMGHGKMSYRKALG